MILRPVTRSTLFPYTTLFRSRKRKVAAGDAALEKLSGLRRQRWPRLPWFVGKRGHRCRDRKSTRLNSSHLGISYAVFCLKKKKMFNNLNHHFLPISE